MGKIINATQARSNINNLIDETAQSHEPMIIMGRRNNAVMISEEDWETIQDILDETISDQRIDEVKSVKMKVYTLDEVTKILILENAE